VHRRDRLYALVEKLRADAPRPLTARWLATYLGVSTRTVERDIATLQRAGVPIHAQAGRRGGYVLDVTQVLPLAITPPEAVAVAVALQVLAGTPLRDAARSALHKVLAVMPDDDIELSGQLARSVRALGSPSPDGQVSGEVEEALKAGVALHISYLDPQGVVSEQTVEPLGFLSDSDEWYLVAWCRSEAAVRAFRMDGIRRAEATDEHVPPRPVDFAELDVIGRELVGQGSATGPVTL